MTGPHAGLCTKSRESIYGASVRAAAERAAQVRNETDRLACDLWNKRMLTFQGPPALADARPGPKRRLRFAWSTGN